MVRFFILLAFTLTVGGLLAASPPPPYPECADLVGKGGYEVCQNEAFSRRRLNAGSSEDQYAARANGYRPPTAEVDSVAGSAIDACGRMSRTCIQACADKGDCIQRCHLELVTCAGIKGSGSNLAGGLGSATAEPPDTYIIEFDDSVAKKR